MATEKTTPAPVGRTRRTPIGTRNRLSVRDQDPNYHYRVVNVVDGRVELLQEQGYEIVSTQVGDTRVDNPQGLGSASQIPVGNGIKAVVMRQRKDWYQEDQKTKQTSIDELEASMHSAAKRGV